MFESEDPSFSMQQECAKISKQKLDECLTAETAEELTPFKAPSYSFLVAAACLAPTAKNSVMTSSGMPLVSGTFKKTKTQEMRHTTA